MKHHKTTTLKPNNPILTNLLSRYPYFFSQNINSTHYKYHNTLASLISLLKHDTKIMELNNRLRRPLKIWRHQTQPNKHKICYMIEINNIKHASLYQEEKNNNNILLAEQNFEKGINTYNNYHELISNTIIPNNRFYIEIETYEGLIFQKGFPENDIHKGDIYDHDSALDTIGLLYNLPRRKYQINIPPKNYPSTHPPFCNSNTEWDYYYETRLKNHITSFGKRPLHILMLENIFEITPQITGRWRQVARMEQDNMESPENAKYMASTNWNSNVYDVKYDLEDLPKNLLIPDSWDIYKLLEKTFPIGAHIFFQITEEAPIETQITLKDNINIKIEIKDHIPMINDNVKLENSNHDAY